MTVLSNKGYCSSRTLSSKSAVVCDGSHSHAPVPLTPRNALGPEGTQEGAVSSLQELMVLGAR